MWCFIDEERCDMLSFVLVSYGDTKQQHQTEPGWTKLAHRFWLIIYLNNNIIKLLS